MMKYLDTCMYYIILSQSVFHNIIYIQCTIRPRITRKRQFEEAQSLFPGKLFSGMLLSVY